MKKKRHCSLPALLLFAAALLPVLQGCSFYRDRRCVTVGLPEVPRDWSNRFSGLRFSVTVPDPDNREGFSRVTVPPGKEHITIDIPKAAFVPCLVEPLVPAGRLKPAGVLIAEGAGALAFPAEWENGFAALILLKLFYRQEIYPGINGERLEDEIVRKGDGNVWDLDPAPILLGLSFGSFRSDKIRPLPLAAVEIPLQDGRWFWGNPFRQPVSAAGESEMTMLELPKGRHHLYHAETEEHVSIFIGEKEWFAVYSLKGTCISGSL